jgi:hypothetical protein
MKLRISLEEVCIDLLFYNVFMCIPSVSPNIGSFGAVYLCHNVKTLERKAVKVFFHGDEKVCFLW